MNGDSLPDYVGKQVIALDRPVYVVTAGRRECGGGSGVTAIRLTGINVLYLIFVWSVAEMENFGSEEECRLVMESRFAPVVYDAGDGSLNVRNENVMSVVRDANPWIEDVLKGYGLS